MDFRLKRITDVGRLDGAIGFDIRPLDFAPQSYGSIRAYPDGPIDPARPKYKRATGGLLLKQPMQIDATAQQWLTNASKGRKPLAEIIAAGRVSDIHPDLLVVENDGVFRGTHDIMLYISDGRIGNYFRCVKRELEESGRFAHASCSVYGNYGSLSYKHRFDRDFLPEWTAQVTKKTFAFASKLTLGLGLLLPQSGH